VSAARIGSTDQPEILNATLPAGAGAGKNVHDTAWADRAVAEAEVEVPGGGASRRTGPASRGWSYRPIAGSRWPGPFGFAFTEDHGAH